MSAPLTRAELRAVVDAQPRLELAHLPTPIDALPVLGRQLGIPELLVKRDDATGLALGGNKARMFEFVLGEARANGCDAILSGAAVPANYCRQLAASCARAGMSLDMVLGQRPAETRSGRHDRAIRFFPELLGATVHPLETADWRAVEARLDEVEAQLTAEGRSVLRLQGFDEGGGGRLWTLSFGRHAIGYVAAFLELLDQLDARGSELVEIWLCSSEATQAGLVLAARALGHPCRIAGISPVASTEPDGAWSADIAAIARECAEILGLDATVAEADVLNLPGYEAGDEGEYTPESLAAVLRVGADEGLLLDPVYTGKAMAAMIAAFESGRRPADGAVVFLHTGGVPATMSYAPELARARA